MVGFIACLKSDCVLFVSCKNGHRLVGKKKAPHVAPVLVEKSYWGARRGVEEEGDEILKNGVDVGPLITCCEF
jgi:hypothetical protein